MRNIVPSRLNQLGELFDSLRRSVYPRDSIKQYIDDIRIRICDPLVVAPGFACQLLSTGCDEHRDDGDQHAQSRQGVQHRRGGIGHGRNPNGVRPGAEHPILVRVPDVLTFLPLGSGDVPTGDVPIVPPSGIAGGSGTIGDWLLFALGVAVVISTAASVTRTLIMTRASRLSFSEVVGAAIRIGVGLVAQRFKNYRRRDAIQSWVAPLMIIGSLATWLICFLFGYMFMLQGMLGMDPTMAFREAGSSLFTLGFASGDRGELSIIDFMAAATGPITIGLMISYLPALYGAFNRRELEVALLKARAGEPNWGPEILARFSALEADHKRLDEMWKTWERWAADVSESHTTYTALIYTRSARPMRNWVVALLSVMDAAALTLALRPHDRQVTARILIRQGVECLRDLAAATGIPYDLYPAEGTPIKLPKEEFLEGVAMMVESGYKVQRPAEDAWRYFSDWRMMYESIAYELALRIDAVPAKWTGPRRPPTEPIPPYRPRYVVESPDGSLAFPESARKPAKLRPRKRLG